jgi:hypothetical protein
MTDREEALVHLPALGQTEVILTGCARQVF